MAQHFPNFLTLLSLTSGSLGIILALQGALAQAAICIWVGGVLDFLDGWLARLLRAHSPLGQQLDAMADLVTFGLLPANIMYGLISQHTPSAYTPLVSLLLPIFSALRLARFNIDTEQKTVFKGLPTPASGLFISTLPWIIVADRYSWLTAVLTRPGVLASVVVIVAGLLVAPIRCMAFKFTTYAWLPNRGKYSFLLTSALLVLSWQIEGLALALVLYGLVGIYSCTLTHN